MSGSGHVSAPGGASAVSRSSATDPASSTQPVRRIQPPTPRVALLIGAVVVVAALLYLGRGALTPFIIGLLLVYLLDPAVQFLARRKVPAALAVLIVYVATAFLVVEGLTLLLGPLIDQIAGFVRDLPALMSSLDGQLRRLTEIYNRLQLPSAVRDAIDSALASVAAGEGGFDPSTLLPIARTIAGTVASAFGYLIVPVWAFYLLKDRTHLVARFDQALPAAWRDDAWALLSIVERIFGRWLRGQLILGFVVGTLTFAGLLLLGQLIDPRFLQFAILLAVIAGVLELLPIIGPIIAAIPTLLVALTISPEAVIGVLVLYTAVQQFENNVLVPKIQGDAIELHPSVVIFALILGGAIAGLLGAIFSLPVTAAARDVYRYLFRRLSGEPAAASAEGTVAEDGVGQQPPPPERTPVPAPARQDSATAPGEPSESAGVATDVLPRPTDAAHEQGRP
ncbi:MAG: AI-2E family transporter [Chloroflexi bacterium]|nr:AI-2E family transporter [Chloroflexota bacterium]